MAKWLKKGIFHQLNLISCSELTELTLTTTPTPSQNFSPPVALQLPKKEQTFTTQKWHGTGKDDRRGSEAWIELVLNAGVNVHAANTVIVLYVGGRHKPPLHCKGILGTRGLDLWPAKKTELLWMTFPVCIHITPTAFLRSCWGNVPRGSGHEPFLKRTTEPFLKRTTAIEIDFQIFYVSYLHFDHSLSKSFPWTMTLIQWGWKY